MAHGYGTVVGEVGPSERADLAAPHARGEGELYRYAQGLRLRASRQLQHARALLVRQGVDGRLHALGWLAEVAGVLGDEVLRHAPLEGLLEQTEGLGHALGRIAVGAHVAYPARHVLHGEVGQADVPM